MPIKQCIVNFKGINLISPFVVLDTGKWSILHGIFRNKNGGKVQYFKPFFFTSLFTFWLPLLIALWYFGFTALIRPSAYITMPYLHDFNAIMMFLFIVPFIVTFLVNDRNFVPDALASVFQNGEAEIKEAKLWQQRLDIGNVLAQFLGLIIGIIFGFINYETLIVKGEGYWGAHRGYMNIPGMVMIFWQIPFYAFCLTVYTVRYGVYIWMLSRLASRLKVFITLFHHDKCSGLKKIGMIGYKNQYVISILFLNLIAAALSLKLWKPDSDIHVQLIGLALLNLILGPIIFFGTLLPFREKILDLKMKEQIFFANKYRAEFKRIKSLISDEASRVPDPRDLNRLELIIKKLDHISVWPFDAASLRKFFGAYVAPLIMAIAPAVVKWFAGVLLK